MNGRRKKSKKPYAASSRPLPEIVFFLDRSLGKHSVAEALLEAGARVELHDRHLPIDAPDEDWIQLVGAQRWLAITKDKNIRYRTSEIAAIKRYKAMVVVVRAKHVTGPEIGQILTGSIARLTRYTATHGAPFVVGIDRNGRLSQYEV